MLIIKVDMTSMLQDVNSVEDNRLYFINNLLEHEYLNPIKYLFYTPELTNIWTLQNLTAINISKNNLYFLPKELGSLLHLQQLSVSYNRLGESTKNNKWQWLEQPAIQKSLTILDISNNSLTEMPEQIQNLNSLQVLKVCQSMMIRLSSSIFELQVLKYHIRKRFIMIMLL